MPHDREAESRGGRCVPNKTAKTAKSAPLICWLSSHDSVSQHDCEDVSVQSVQR